MLESFEQRAHGAGRNDGLEPAAMKPGAPGAPAQSPINADVALAVDANR